MRQDLVHCCRPAFPVPSPLGRWIPSASSCAVPVQPNHALNISSPILQAHNLLRDLVESYTRLSRKKMKENSDNPMTRSTKVRRRSPFQDFTNLVDSRISSDAKRDLLITGTKRPIYPSGASIQSSTPQLDMKVLFREMLLSISVIMTEKDTSG